MTATWAAVVVAIAALAATIVIFVITATRQSARDAEQRGERDGKVDAVLARLTDIAGDHEARLRSGGL